MNLDELRKHLRRNPEYVAVENELQPFLDVAMDIIHLRSQRKWTQAQLAERVGTKQGNISRIERSSSNPSLKLLQRVANALGGRLVVHIEPIESFAEQATTNSNIVEVPNWPMRDRSLITISGGDAPNESVRVA